MRFVGWRPPTSWKIRATHLLRSSTKRAEAPPVRSLAWGTNRRQAGRRGLRFVPQPGSRRAGDQNSRCSAPSSIPRNAS